MVNFSNPNPKVKINDYMEHLNEVVGEISGKVYIISHSLGTAIVEKYIMQLKLKEAAYLLANTDMSLADISNQLSFSLQSHLNNNFKLRT